MSKTKVEACKAKALAFITGRGRAGASAVEIGSTIANEWRRADWRRARNMDMADKEALGLATASRLASDGLVVAMRGNRFMLASHATSMPSLAQVK
jgi:hypothetical protein